MATYIPNATQTTEPVESRTVESAALEFRTLKASINTEVANRIAGDANLQAQNNAQDVRLTAIENALPFIGEGGLPGTVYVQRLSGTGAQTVFTLNTAPQSNNVVDIYINGIYQNKDTFTVSGADVIFSKAPPAGTNNIEVQVTATIALGETAASLVTYGGTTVAAQLDAITANFVQVTGNQTLGIPTGTILGRASADTGDVEALTGAQATALLSAASETVSGLVELATAAEAQALASAVVALTPARLADAFKGANQSLSGSGYQRLPGGLIVQWGAASIPSITAGIGGSGVLGSITFPIAFPNACRAVSAITNSVGSNSGEHVEIKVNIEGFTASTFWMAALRLAGGNTGGELVGISWMAIGN